MEVRDKAFTADQAVLDLRLGQTQLGLTGFLVYDGQAVRGFVEYMPEQVAPGPVIAPGAAVLICCHWKPPAPDLHGPEHLRGERQLLEKALQDAREAGYTGMATLAWDVPIHYPASEFETLGFRRLASQGQLALMWYPFRTGGPDPQIAGLPQRELVVVHRQLIDTREQALAALADCWNWEWSFVNGKDAFLFGLKADKVSRLILDALGS